MTLRFTLTKEDLYHYWLHSMLDSKIWRRKRIYQWVIFGIISAVILYKLIFIRFEFGPGELVMILFALYVVYFRRFFLQIILKRRVKTILRQDKEEAILGEKEIHFDDVVTMKSKEGEGRANYSTFVAFEQDENAFYLVLPDTSGVIIPKRIFSDKNAIEEFSAFVNNKIMHA